MVPRSHPYASQELHCRLDCKLQTAGTNEHLLGALHILSRLASTTAMAPRPPELSKSHNDMDICGRRHVTNVAGRATVIQQVAINSAQSPNGA